MLYINVYEKGSPFLWSIVSHIHACGTIIVLLLFYTVKYALRPQ